jgi:predicted permease
MFEKFIVVVTQTTILFLMMVVGVFARRFKMFDEISIKKIADFVLIVITPCLIVKSFQQPFEQAMLKGVCWSFILALFSHFVAIISSRVLVADSDEGRLRTMRFATVFSNAGYMGIPLQYAILGDRGVFYGSIYVVVFHVLCWTYGVWEMRGSFKGESFFKIIFNPGLLGVALGIPFFLFSIKLPTVLSEPVKMISSMYTPLAMLVLGYYLAGAKFSIAFKCKGSYLVLFMRHFLIPSSVMIFLYCLPFVSYEVALSAMIPSSAPIAASVAMFSARYGRQPEFITALVAVSTLLSIITMPILITISMTLF